MLSTLTTFQSIMLGMTGGFLLGLALGNILWGNYYKTMLKITIEAFKKQHEKLYKKKGSNKGNYIR